MQPTSPGGGSHRCNALYALNIQVERRVVVVVVVGHRARLKEPNQLHLKKQFGVFTMEPFQQVLSLSDKKGEV